MSGMATTLKRAFVIVSASLLLTSCAFYRLEELRHTTPVGTPFQTELSRMYMEFASDQEKGYDWFNSAYFAGKGLSLAYGQDVGPEAIAEWSIPPDVVPAMQDARARVLAALTPDVKRDRPSRAAEAQFYFDCWVKFQDAGWNEEEIAYCHDNLMLSLEILGVPDAKKAPEMQAEKEKKPAPKPKKEKKAVIKEAPKAESKEPAPLAQAPAPEESNAPKPTVPGKAQTLEPVTSPETVSYVVFFQKDKADLSDPGKAVMQEVVASLKKMSDYEVILHGSTYKAGKPTEENPDLRAPRAEAVRKLLMEAGIKPEIIKIFDENAAADAKPPAHRIELFLNE